MWANPQFLQHLSCAVLQPAEIVCLGGQWEVSQVRHKFIRMEWSLMLSADSLECCQPVLEALEVRLEMTAPVQ